MCRLGRGRYHTRQVVLTVLLTVSRLELALFLLCALASRGCHCSACASSTFETRGPVPTAQTRVASARAPPPTTRPAAHHPPLAARCSPGATTIATPVCHKSEWCQRLGRRHVCRYRVCKRKRDARFDEVRQRRHAQQAWQLQVPGWYCRSRGVYTRVGRRRVTPPGTRELRQVPGVLDLPDRMGLRRQPAGAIPALPYHGIAVSKTLELSSHPCISVRSDGASGRGRAGEPSLTVCQPRCCAHESWPAERRARRNREQVIRVNSTAANPDLGVLDVLGWLVWLCGFALQFVSDMQKLRFRSRAGPPARDGAARPASAPVAGSIAHGPSR